MQLNLIECGCIIYFQLAVASSPTNLTVNEIGSRSFEIKFAVPINVSGILAGYKILILNGEKCVQQITVAEGDYCPKCVVREFTNSFFISLYPLHLDTVEFSFIGEWAMFVDCHFGCNFVGNWFVALQCETIHITLLFVHKDANSL